MKETPFLPWHKALGWIFLSTLLISGSFGLVIAYWRYYKVARTTDARYNIVAIVQECDSKEPLQTDYLAELLGLSANRPVNLYRFNIQEALKKLQACSIIKTAMIKKIFPGMIYVKYQLRKPAAYLADYSNSAIDEKGYLIPAKPFYTPKNIPELYLGLPKGLTWGEKIVNQNIALAKEVLLAFSQLNHSQAFRLKRVDVSKAFSKQYGDREMVLFLESQSSNESACQLSIVRLSPDNWKSQLERFPKLYQRLAAGGYREFSKVKNRYVIDMRISQLAFIGEND